MHSCGVCCLAERRFLSLTILELFGVITLAVAYSFGFYSMVTAFGKEIATGAPEYVWQMTVGAIMTSTMTFIAAMWAALRRR